MTPHPLRRRTAFLRALLPGTLLLGALALPAAAHNHTHDHTAQPAHTHGHAALDVAVDGTSITLTLKAALDGLLGFERAPRTDAERARVAAMVARLKAADQLFQPDPAGACTLAAVELASPVLGLGPKAAQGQGTGKGTGTDDDAHADLDMQVVFTCAQAAQARFIDVKLFDSFRRLRTIDAQVAAPQGQFKRALRPGAARLALGR